MQITILHTAINHNTTPILQMKRVTWKKLNPRQIIQHHRQTHRQRIRFLQLGCNQLYAHLFLDIYESSMISSSCAIVCFNREFVAMQVCRTRRTGKRPFNHCSVEYIGDHETSFELNIGISRRQSNDVSMGNSIQVELATLVCLILIPSKLYYKLPHLICQIVLEKISELRYILTGP